MDQPVHPTSGLHRWDLLLVATATCPALGGNARAHFEQLTYNPPPEFGDELRSRWRYGLQTGDAVFRVTKVQPTLVMTHMTSVKDATTPHGAWLVEITANLLTFTTNAEVSSR